MPGLRPNPMANDVPNHHRLLAPDTTPEDQMTIADDLNVTGSMTLRVDCNCNAYSKEEVTVPFVVIMDALVALEEDDTSRTVLTRTKADPRITATGAGGAPLPRPSADFADTHLAQVAATVRNRRLVPFNPFAGNAAHLKATRPIYHEWLARYQEQLAAADMAAPLNITDAAPTEQVIAVGPEGITGWETTTAAAPATLTVDEAHEALEVANDAHPNLAPADTEALTSGPGHDETSHQMADTYPDPDHATNVVDWVGDNYHRAVYAWAREEDRKGGIRATVRTHVDELGVDTGDA